MLNAIIALSLIAVLAIGYFLMKKLVEKPANKNATQFVFFPN